jgi:hypothetical protein
VLTDAGADLDERESAKKLIGADPPRLLPSSNLLLRDRAKAIQANSMKCSVHIGDGVVARLPVSTPAPGEAKSRHYRTRNPRLGHPLPRIQAPTEPSEGAERTKGVGASRRGLGRRCTCAT